MNFLICSISRSAYKLTHFVKVFFNYNKALYILIYLPAWVFGFRLVQDCLAWFKSADISPEMLRSLFMKGIAKHGLHLARFHPQVNYPSSSLIFRNKGTTLGYLILFFLSQRGMHTRNKKAMELIARGWSALKEVDRVIDYCELNDKRLIPLLRVNAFVITYLVV